MRSLIGSIGGSIEVFDQFHGNDVTAALNSLHLSICFLQHPVNQRLMSSLQSMFKQLVSLSEHMICPAATIVTGDGSFIMPAQGAPLPEAIVSGRLVSHGGSSSTG